MVNMDATPELDTGDKAHQVTSKIYKDLQLDFTQCLKMIWSTGKALHKALEVVSTKAKAHHDSITILGQTASNSSGTVQDIGEALIQMAEVYREIQSQIDESVSAFKKEMCNPIEFVLLDNGSKMEDKLRRYMKEHNKLLTPYKKSVANLTKHRKKNKNSVPNPKEMQCYREATEHRTALDKYRLKHLKEVLFEEKTTYIHVMEKLLSVSKNQADTSRKTQELLHTRLSDWDALVKVKDLNKDTRRIIDSMDEINTSNGTTPHMDGDNSSHYSGTLPRSVNDPLPVPPVPKGLDKPRVRALYNHASEEDSQLSFLEGDIIRLLGEPRDGWHYGQNNTTKECGWFPVSFTEPMNRNTILNTEPSLASSKPKSRSVFDLTADDSPQPPRHRTSHLQPHSSMDNLIMERSTMTLPHKRAVGSPNMFFGGGGRSMPPGVTPSQGPLSPPLPAPPPDVTNSSFTLPHNFRKGMNLKSSPGGLPPPPQASRISSHHYTSNLIVSPSANAGFGNSNNKPLGGFSSPPVPGSEPPPPPPPPPPSTGTVPCPPPAPPGPGSVPRPPVSIGSVPPPPPPPGAGNSPVPPPNAAIRSPVSAGSGPPPPPPAGNIPLPPPPPPCPPVRR